MEEFIEETLLNVKRQTIPPNAIYVIDDGSEDNMAEIAASVNGVTVLRNESNKGKSFSRNRGITRSTAPFIQLIDADDLLESRKVEIQLSYLSQHPDCDAVWGDMDYFTVNERGEKKFRGVRTYEDVDDLLGQLIKINLIGLHSYLFRREYFDKAGLFDERFVTSQDRELWIRALLKDADVRYTPGAICHYRRHETSTIASQQKKAAYYNALAVRVHARELAEIKDGLYRDLTASTLRMLARNSNRYLRPMSEVFQIIDEANSLYGTIVINQNPLYNIIDSLFGYKLTELILRPKFKIDHLLGRYDLSY